MLRVNNEESAARQPREQDVIGQGRRRWSHSDPIPKAGFQCVAVNDLGRWNYTACEMCGTRIRYVHTMQHPEWHEQPDVGYVCAGHLERPSEADDAAPFVKVAKEREQPLNRLEARAARRRRKLEDDKHKLFALTCYLVTMVERDLTDMFEPRSSPLRRLMDRAHERLREAQSDEAPVDDEVKHIGKLTEFIDKARCRRDHLRQIKLSVDVHRRLDQPAWEPRRAGRILRIPLLIEVWVYERDGVFKAACKMPGQDGPTWGRARCATVDESARRAIFMARRALVDSKAILPKDHPDVARLLEPVVQ